MGELSAGKLLSLLPLGVVVVQRRRQHSIREKPTVGRNFLPFPEPGLFHFEPREDSVHLPNEERLDHAVGFPALRLATVAVDGCLNDPRDVITELQH